jgi:hypothetical protein
MIRRLVLLAAAIAVAAPLLIIANAGQAGATWEFTFTDHQTNFQAIIGGQSTLNPTSAPGPGDTFVIRDDIIQNGSTVGYDNVACTVTFNDNLLCNAVLAFNGKGDLTATALLRGDAGNVTLPYPFDVAITGGTFLYRNAHGDAHVVDTTQGDSTWTVNFATQ